MMAYVQAVNDNAALLITIGNRAIAAAEPNTVEAAQQLVDNAMLLKRKAFFALVQLWMAWARPGSPFCRHPNLSRIRPLERFRDASRAPAKSRSPSPDLHNLGRSHLVMVNPAEEFMRHSSL